MERQFISAKIVCQKIGVSRTTLWRLASADEFPKPIRIGRRALYDTQAVDDWMQEKVAA